MKKIICINANTLFDIFIFLTFLILCSDADNGKIINFVIFGLLLSVILKQKIHKKILLMEANIWNYLFIGLSILSIIWSISLSDSLAMITVLLRRTIIIFTICTFIRTFKDVEKLLIYYLIANFIMMIKLSFYMLNGISGVTAWDEITGNYFNTVAQFLAIAIIVAYYFLMKSKHDRVVRIFYAIFIVFAFYHIYLTGSRKGLMMPIVEFAIFRIVESGFNIKKIAKNILLMVIGTIVIIYFLMQNQEIYNRIQIIINMFISGATGDESTATRQYYITLARQMFIENPILGQGINSFAYVLKSITGVYRYSHNNFMEILSGTGVLGFVLYYWFYIKLGIGLYKNRGIHYINVLGFSILFTLTMFEFGVVTYSIYIYPIILSIFSVLCNKETLLVEEGAINV